MRDQYRSFVHGAINRALYFLVLASFFRFLFALFSLTYKIQFCDRRDQFFRAPTASVCLGFCQRTIFFLSVHLPTFFLDSRKCWVLSLGSCGKQWWHLQFHTCFRIFNFTLVFGGIFNSTLVFVKHEYFLFVYDNGEIER